MKDRYRSFMLVLYPEDKGQMDALAYIQEFYDYAYILHNKDFNDRGEIKKEHYHVVIKLKNGITISSLSKKLNLPGNYITPSRKNYLNALRYLIHADDPDKYQYPIDEVIGPLKKNLIKSLEGDKNEGDVVLEILNLLEEQDYLSITSFIRLIISTGYYSYYRRNAYTFNLILNEHNQNVIELRRSLHNIDYRN